jgi:hypothetical protein
MTFGLFVVAVPAIALASDALSGGCGCPFCP